MTEAEAVLMLEGKLPCIVTDDVHGSINRAEELKQCCISALEKQIAKKPYVVDSIAWHCPCCDGYIRSIYTRKEIILDEHIFCGRCGQKLDWSEV